MSAVHWSRCSCVITCYYRLKNSKGVWDVELLDEYLARPYRLEIIPDTAEGGYIAFYPDLPGCITCGETMENAEQNAQDAKKEWLQAAIENGILQTGI